MIIDIFSNVDSAWYKLCYKNSFFLKIAAIYLLFYFRYRYGE